MRENIAIFDINRIRFATVPFRNHIFLIDNKDPFQKSRIFLAFLSTTVTQTFEMHSRHTIRPSLWVTILYVVIFINASIDVQEDIPLSLLFDEIGHQLGKIVLTVQMLLTSYHPVHPLYAQNLFGG